MWLAIQVAAQLRGPCNALILNDTFVTCGKPDGECLAWLASHGVDTLICVDGAVPNIPAAQEAGLRVLHLPCTYNTIPEEVTMAIAKAAQEARQRGKRVATHCHHGKHRSPAAAAAAMRALGYSESDALGALTRAGTSPAYAGLWSAVREQVAYDTDDTNDTAAHENRLSAVQLRWDTPVPPAPFVELMAQMEDQLDALAAAARVQCGGGAGRGHEGTPPNAPAAAGALVDLCRLAADEASSREEGMTAHLLQLADDAQELESALVANPNTNELQSGLARIQSECRACHSRYRSHH